MKRAKLQGFKGETPPKPIEINDTIQSSGKAYIVDLLCEGEIEDMVAMYIDEAEYNTTDFPTVDFVKATNFRAGKRRTAQTILGNRFAGAKVPLPIPQSSQLKKTRPITVNFNSNTYPDATSVLVNMKFPSMLRQVAPGNQRGQWEVEGDVRQTRVQYQIILTENGVARPAITEVIDQKSGGGFIWSTRIQLNPDPARAVNEWKIRIERQTADSTSIKISDDTFLDSVIIETSYSYNYPNTAISSLALDALNFPSIAQRAYKLKLLKIKVPNGYTPTQYDSEGNVTAAATYPGVWNGTFSSTLVWTDNPAWIFYDLLTNRRYGLGEFINADALDKWTLYSIAKYCDELVDKGNGESGLDGLEPRFTCNLFLTTTEEAYTVVNNLASVFRGVTYWMSGKIFPVQDRPKESTQQFTNANVLNGIFSYSTTGKGQRRTVAQIRWNDPKDFYRPKIEYVEDTEGVIRFGVREMEVGAFACTSRGQAYRVGKWSLLSERLEAEVVNFETGMDGTYARPGDVIEIYDNFRTMQKQGGRTLDMNTSRTQVVLDRAIDYDSNLDYELSLSIPKANRDPGYTGSDTSQTVTSSSQTGDIRKSFIETKAVTSLSFSGDYTVCDVGDAYSERYIGGTWVVQALHSVSGKIRGSKPYRVLNIRETEEKNLAINALEYSPEKFNVSETGFTVRISPSTDYGENPINPPTSLSASQQFQYQSETFNGYIQASWTASTGPYLSHHVASGRKLPSGLFTGLLVYDNGSKATMTPTESGTYQIQVAAVQVGGAISAAITANVTYGATNPLGSTVIPVSGIVLENRRAGSQTEYDERQPQFSFLLSPTGTDGTDQRRAFLLGVETRFKDIAGNVLSDWTLVDEDAVLTIPYDYTGISGWPMRTGTLEVRARDYWNNYSASKTLTFVNPAPPLASMTVVSKTKDQFSYMLEPLAGIPTDFSGVYFWANTTSSMPPTSTIKNSLAGELVHNLNSDDVYAWWSLADDFHPSGLNINGPYLIAVGSLGSAPSNLTLSLSGNLDEWNNEHFTLYSTWDRMESGDVRDYYIYLTDNSGARYNYVVPQSPSGTKPYFHFDSVVPDRTYQAQVRGRNGEGRTTALSALTAGVTVGKPKIRFLQVEGKSYFFEPTYVRMSNQNVSASMNVDYGQGNIIRLNMTHGGTAVLGAQNIQSGSTYLVYLYRQANAGGVTFSSNYKWPDGEPPDISTSVGAVDVISAFAIDSNNLYCVTSNNFS